MRHSSPSLHQILSGAEVWEHPAASDGGLEDKVLNSLGFGKQLGEKTECPIQHGKPILSLPRS